MQQTFASSCPSLSLTTYYSLNPHTVWGDKRYGPHTSADRSPESIGWKVGWQAGWLAGWLADWLAGWLTGWIAAWLDGRSVKSRHAIFTLFCPPSSHTALPLPNESSTMQVRVNEPKNILNMYCSLHFGESCFTLQRMYMNMHSYIRI